MTKWYNNKMINKRITDADITHTSIPTVLEGSIDDILMDRRFVNVVKSDNMTLFSSSSTSASGSGPIVIEVPTTGDKPELSDIESISKSIYFDAKTNTNKAKLVFKIRNNSGQDLIGIDARVGGETSGTLSFTIEPIVTVSSTSAIISWSAAGQSSYSITGLNTTYTGTTESLVTATPLSTTTSYTAILTIRSSSGDSISRTLTFTTGAISTANINQIVATNGGKLTPFMIYQVSSANAVSAKFTVYRRLNSSSPWRENSNTGTFVNGILIVSVGAGASGYEYYITITPYSGPNGTGTAGISRTSTNKINYPTVTSLTNNY